MRLLVAVFVLFAMVAIRWEVDAKVLTREEIVKGLVQHKFSRSFLSNCKYSTAN